MGMMTDYMLPARTEPGRRFVSAVEEHTSTFAARAEQHDREGSFPFQNFDDLRRSGVIAAAIPEHNGGMGVESLHDLMIGMSRLGSGDASTAIAANMHISGGAVIVRMLRRSRAACDHRKVEILED